jgi:alpha-L-fucosidase 2
MPLKCSSKYLVIMGISLVFVMQSCQSNEIQANLPGPEDGLLFETPSFTWDEGIPLGNGIMGALVWGDGNPLKISLDRADLWDLRKVPEFYSGEYDFNLMRQWHLAGRTEDLVRLYEDPYNRPAPTKIPAGRIELDFPSTARFESTRLSLVDAQGSVKFGESGELQLFLHAEKPVGMMRSDSPVPPELRLVPPLFAGEVKDPAAGGIGAGDLTQLGYPAPEISKGDNWTAFYQKGAEGFSFAIFVKSTIEDGKWETAWSVASSFESDRPLELARKRVQEALDLGFEEMKSSHSEWWDRYWRKATIKLPNPILERQWFLEQYKFGSASRRGAPPISLQAVWTADDGKLPPWKGDYHHDLNTQLSYWPCYSGNRLEEGLSYLDWLWNTRDTGFSWTKRFFKLPGLNVPMTTDLNGDQIGGWRQYTHSATTAAWLSHHFYLHWKFSQDREFLQNRAYPYLRDACIFLEAFTRGKDDNGIRTFPLSASPEIYDNRPEAWFPVPTNYDVALTRWLFSAASELAGELKLDQESSQWSEILSELPDLAVSQSEGLLVAPGHPLEQSHRHFSHLMAIHPLGLVDISDSTSGSAIVNRSLDRLNELGTDWWTGYSFSWLGNLHAWARRPEEAEKALELFSTAFTLRNSFHCNGDQTGKGYSRFTYRPFTLEGNFAAAAGIQEMLLQSHRGQIQIFPAVPDSWMDVEFTDLRAQGAFLVSARRTGGKTRWIKVLSEKGGLLRLESPFTGELLEKVTAPGDFLVFDR